MTDKIFALTVALESDTRGEDIQNIITAIKALRGVLNVEPHVANITLYTTQERVRRELGDKLWEILYPKIQ
jgi:hypothetical protein